jgi:FG-GAP repeat
MKQLWIGLLLSLAPFANMSGTKLQAPTPAQYAEYGYGVSANGNTLAVINASSANSGVIYVYQPAAKNWNTATLVAQLTASNGATFSSVAVYGNVIVAGALEQNNAQGVVYGFTAPESGWQNANQSFVLTASDGAANDDFGNAVAFSQKTIVVGAPGHGSGAGAAYIFTEPTNGWASGTQTAELTPSNGGGIGLGSSVAVNGVFVAVGTEGSGGGSGAAFVYQENPGGWQNSTEQAQLSYKEGEPCDTGLSVAIVSSTIVVGATCRYTVPGRALVYERPGNAWSSTSVPTAVLTYKASEAGGQVFSLALTNNFLLVGDPGAGIGQDYEGGVFVYPAPQGGWQNVVNATDSQWIKPGAGGKYSDFGYSVTAFSTGTMFIGAPGFTVDGNRDAGEVFIKSY